MIQNTCEWCCMKWARQTVSNSLHLPHQSLNVQRNSEVDVKVTGM